MDFRNLDVTVTLKGEEWFAIMARLANKGLSTEGHAILAEAKRKLAASMKGAAMVNAENEGESTYPIG
jgi:hypothetical protein